MDIEAALAIVEGRCIGGFTPDSRSVEAMAVVNREIERLTRGIEELERLERGNIAYVDHCDSDQRWYVFTLGGECNDDRRADTLLDLVRKLGESSDDIRQTPDNP